MKMHKMMKKIISMILVIAMMLGCIPSAAFASGSADVSAEETGGAAVTVTADKYEAGIGDTVEVTFTLSDNPGFTNTEMMLTFDKDILTFTGLKEDEEGEYVGLFGRGIPVVNTDPANGAYGAVVFAREKALTADGVLFIAEFKVTGVGKTAVGVDITLMNNSGETGPIPTVVPSDEITTKGISATSVVVDPKEVSLEEGMKTNISAVVEPSDTTDSLKWSSSDETVVIVNDRGSLTAVGAGEATITAQAGDVSDTCTVTVTKATCPLNISPDGYSNKVNGTATGIFNFQFGEESLSVKNVYKFDITGMEALYLLNDTPDYSYYGYKLDGTQTYGGYWGGFNNQLYLDAGWFRTHRVTYAALNQAMGDDNMKKLGVGEDDLISFVVYKGSFNYAVLFRIAPVEAMGLSISEKFDLFAGDSVNVSLTLDPLSSTEWPTWTSSDPEVAVVDENGKITAVKEGTVTITAAIGKFKDECTVKVYSEPTEILLSGTPDDWGGYVEKVKISGVDITGYSYHCVENTNDPVLDVYIAEKSEGSAYIKFFINDGREFSNSCDITDSEGTCTTDFKPGENPYTDDQSWTVNFHRDTPAASVTVDKETVELLIGRTDKLTATISPEESTDRITWMSSDAAVVSVNQNGNITALKEGTATITAKARDGVEAVCTVTVIAVHADEIYLDSEDYDIGNGKISIKIGENIALTATTEPTEITDELTWETSNKKIAAATYGYFNGESYVGYLTAKSAGETTLTVKAGDTTATLTVEVYAVPATGITLNRTELRLPCDFGDDSSFTLQAAVTPEDTTDQIIWNTSDANVATINNGNVAAVGEGTAEITAQVGEYTATCTVTVYELYDVIKEAPENVPTLPADTFLGWGVSYNQLKVSGTTVTGHEWVSGDNTNDTFVNIYLDNKTEEGTKVKVLCKLNTELSGIREASGETEISGGSGTIRIEQSDWFYGPVVTTVNFVVNPSAEDIAGLIDAIGDVTLDCEQQINDVRAAYDKLSDEDKAQVTNYKKLEEAEKKLADLKAAKEVTDSIAALGDITLESEDTIKELRAAYDNLTGEQKTLVTNYNNLYIAEQTIKSLEAFQKAEKAERAAEEAKKEAEAAKEAAEEAAKKAETEKEAAEEAKKEAEAAKEAAEEAAKKAEAEKTAAEEARKEAEAAKEAVEEAAKKAEADKQAAEEALKKAEAEKGAAEEAAKKAEADKQAAEEARKEAEAEKKAAEEAKKEAEADKQAAEEAAKKAEAALAKLEVLEQKAEFKNGKPAVTVKATAYNQVKISWKTYANTTGYLVYRKAAGQSKWTKLGETKSLSYTDKTALTGTTYYYTIKAVSTKWGGKVYSQYVTNVKTKTSLPAPVISSVKNSKSKQAAVTWKKVSGASGYVVYRAASKNGTYKAVKTITSGKTVTCTNIGLKKGTTYYYKVRAYRTVNGKKVYSSCSAVKSVKITK